LLEAAAMCKPIVTTDSVGCRNTVNDGITGYLCETKNAQALTNAMEKIILMSPEQRQKMGEAGRKKITEEFDEKLILSHYLTTLNRYNIQP
ncbi:MAG: glycosyltransferase, partial [Mucinivorans sp.]